VDDDRVPEAGVVVACPQCGHVFRLKKKALAVTVSLRPEEAPEARPITELAAPATPRPTPAREWRLRQASGNVWAFRELTMLQRWIVERKVTRDDEISTNGEQWRRLADIPELASFFAVVEAADVSQPRPSPRTQTPESRPPAKPLPPMAPAAAIDEPAWAQGLGGEAPAPAPARRIAPREVGRSGAFLALLALALAGGVFAAWFYLSRPGQGEGESRAVPDAGVAEPVALPPEPPPPERISRSRPAPAALALAPAVAPAATREPAAVVEAPPKAVSGAASTVAREPTPEPSAPVAAPAPSAPAASAPAPPAPAAALAPAPPRRPAAPTKASKAKALVAQARKLRERGRTDAALALYRQAVDLEPASAAALAGRGACYLETSDYASAEADFRAALENDPRNAEALFGMAETYRYMGKDREAVTFYERFLAVHPEGDDAAAARNEISKLKE